MFHMKARVWNENHKSEVSPVTKGSVILRFLQECSTKRKTMVERTKGRIGGRKERGRMEITFEKIGIKCRGEYENVCRLC